MPIRSEENLARNLDIRASSKDRENAMQRLEQAFTEERISESEYDERMTAALSAKTLRELEQILMDLPKTGTYLSTNKHPLPAMRSSKWSMAILGGLERKGHWEVPEHFTVAAILGGASLDLREAQLTSHITTINVYALMGGIEIFVPPGIRVETQGIPLLGGFSNKAQDENLSVGAPVLRIRGMAILGGIDIRTKHGRSK